MDTALPEKFPFILDRNLVNSNCTEDRVCTSCDKVVLVQNIYFSYLINEHTQPKSTNFSYSLAVNQLKNIGTVTITFNI